MIEQYVISRMYAEARKRSLRGRIWAVLTGRSRRLLALAESNRICTVSTRRYAGIQMVRINQIRGSEGRSNDFDCDFNPLKSHAEERWKSVARARLQDKSLPPVELVQIGDVYFVQDGHHRISVARALGQRDIEAEVTIWEDAGPRSQGQAALAGRSVLQPA